MKCSHCGKHDMDIISRYRRLCSKCGSIYITRYRYLTATTDDRAIWIDKPAQYSLIRYHEEQIKVPDDFHEWFMFNKKKLRARVGLE